MQENFKDILKKKLRDTKWFSWLEMDEDAAIPAYELEQILAQEQAEKELLAQSELMREFLRHPGWELMERYRVARIDVLRSLLERKAVEDPESIDTRAELRILRGYENFVLSKIRFE